MGGLREGERVTDMPTMQGSWKELEKERFLNMVRPACGLCFACMYCAGEECSFIHHTYSMQGKERASYINMRACIAALVERLGWQCRSGLPPWH